MLRGEKPVGAITERRTTCRARVNEVRSAGHCAMREASTSRSRVAWWTIRWAKISLRLILGSGHRVSCDERQLTCRDQLLFELGRCAVAECGVATAPVVVRQPAEELEPGLWLRGPAASVKQFAFEALEERLGEGIIVT